MRLARLLTLALVLAINVLTLAGCGGGGGGNAAPGGGDTTAPTVSITAPAGGATATGITTITATASDNVGVSRVEFYANGALQGSAVSAPYSFSWDTTALKYGSYALTAKAYDAASNSSQSTGVTVNVPIRVSMASVVTGTTAVGTVALTGIPTADAYGLNFQVTMPSGASIASVSPGTSAPGAAADASGTPIILAGTSISNGQIMQINFQNLPAGTTAADLSISLVAAFDRFGNPILFL